MSVGVQDFDERVQVAVNRVQTEEETALVIRGARQRLQVGFRRSDLRPAVPDRDGFQPHPGARAGDGPGSPVDLQLCAPAQPVQAAAPHRRSPDLPSADTKMQILALAIKKLTDAGYVYIGMDHFAKPDDELAVAQRQAACTAISRAIRPTPTATCCLSAFRRSARSGRPTARTSRRRRVLRPHRCRRRCRCSAASS